MSSTARRAVNNFNHCQCETDWINFRTISSVHPLDPKVALWFDPMPMADNIAVLAVDTSDTEDRPSCILLLPSSHPRATELFTGDNFAVRGRVIDAYWVSTESARFPFIHYSSRAFEMELQSSQHSSDETYRSELMRFVKDFEERCNIEEFPYCNFSADTLEKPLKPAPALKAMMGCISYDEQLVVHGFEEPASKGWPVRMPQFRAQDIAALAAGQLECPSIRYVPTPQRSVPVYLFNMVLVETDREYSFCTVRIDKQRGWIFPQPFAFESEYPIARLDKTPHDKCCFNAARYFWQLPLHIAENEKSSVWVHLINVVIQQVDDVTGYTDCFGKNIPTGKLLQCKFLDSPNDPCFDIFVHRDATGNSTWLTPQTCISVFSCKARPYASRTAMVFDTIADMSHFTFSPAVASPNPSVSDRFPCHPLHGDSLSSSPMYSDIEYLGTDASDEEVEPMPPNDG